MELAERQHVNSQVAEESACLCTTSHDKNFFAFLVSPEPIGPQTCSPEHEHVTVKLPLSTTKGGQAVKKEMNVAAVSEGVKEGYNIFRYGDGIPKFYIKLYYLPRMGMFLPCLFTNTRDSPVRYLGYANELGVLPLL
jgi:hypothetical protein